VIAEVLEFRSISKCCQNTYAIIRRHEFESIVPRLKDDDAGMRFFRMLADIRFKLSNCRRHILRFHNRQACSFR
jgi:hypothetical protein